MPMDHWFFSQEFWKKVLDAVPLTQNIVGSIAMGVLTTTFGYLIGRGVRARRVTISPYKVTGTDAERTKPKVLIASLSYPKNFALPLSDEEFREALRSGDLSRLPLSRATPSIGSAVLLLETYRDSLKEVFFVTTRSTGGGSSSDAVPLLQQWARTNLGDRIVIHTDKRYEVDLEEDDRVARQAYDVCELIFNRLAKEKKYQPKGREILVDVTGGTKSMTLGLLLACLHPEQDVHLVGVHYKPNGDADWSTSFPMGIHFDPRLEGKR